MTITKTVIILISSQPSRRRALNHRPPLRLHRRQAPRRPPPRRHCRHCPRGPRQSILLAQPPLHRRAMAICQRVSHTYW